MAMAEYAQIAKQLREPFASIEVLQDRISKAASAIDQLIVLAVDAEYENHTKISPEQLVALIVKAKAAFARGASRDKIIERFREYGIGYVEEII